MGVSRLREDDGSVPFTTESYGKVEQYGIKS